MSNTAGNRPQNRQRKETRVPVDGARDIMTVFGKSDDFMYRWVTDSDEKGSRIWKFKRGGWDLVTMDSEEEELQIGEEAVYKSEDAGSLYRLHSGAGLFSYLMRIRKEWFKEDQQKKWDAIDALESGIMGETESQGDENHGQYGSIKRQSK